MPEFGKLFWKAWMQVQLNAKALDLARQTNWILALICELFLEEDNDYQVEQPLAR